VSKLNSKLRFFICDFDGVFTDNNVYLNSKGQEFVRCSRYDGYGIRILKAANEMGLANLEISILSTETNKVVSRRAAKLKVECFSGIENKLAFLKEVYFPLFGLDIDKGLSQLIYLGNDLNDLAIMKKAKVSFAPKDSHPLVIKNASFVLKNKLGGNGFVREVIESILGKRNLLSVVDYLESKH